jgi:hypothetical protein
MLNALIEDTFILAALTCKQVSEKLVEIGVVGLVVETKSVGRCRIRRENHGRGEIIANMVQINEGRNEVRDVSDMLLIQEYQDTRLRQEFSFNLEMTVANSWTCQLCKLSSFSVLFLFSFSLFFSRFPVENRIFIFRFTLEKNNCRCSGSSISFSTKFSDFS